MNPDRWNLIQSLFEQAIEKEPTERQKFLDTASGGDTELIKEVLELVNNFSPASDFFYSFEREIYQAFDLEKEQPLQEGMEVEAYRILRELGRGGMAVVYLAERKSDDFDQLVAIKVVRSKRKSTDLLQRFGHERQILARLNHPYIAKLYSGGSLQEGLPYFIMEYIEGESINQYLENHALNIKERIDLFIKVAEAVQYAHQNLIVHRDIKPGNIWVEENGTPKLLDFGIAKLMESSSQGVSAETQTQVRLLTPEYASPEQVSGEPISTATDIYQLGLLLYEMIAASRPFDFYKLSEDKRAQIIKHQIPKAPSHKTDSTRINRRYAQDLDAITLKCLQKEPEARYSSVSVLIQDLQALLGNQPISLRDSEWAYRAKKFFLRNRVGVIAAMLALFFLVGGIFSTTRESIRANQALDDEREARFKQEAISAFLTDLLNNLDPNGYFDYEAGQFKEGRRSLEAMLDDALPKIKTKFAQQAEYRVELIAVVADYYSKLGLPVKSAPARKEILAICDTIGTCDPLLYVFQLRMWAMQQLDLGAIDIVDSALNICSQMLVDPIDHPQYLPEKALLIADQAKLASRKGQLYLSDSLFAQAFDLFYQQPDSVFTTYYEFAVPHLTLSWSRCKKQLGQYDKAIDLAKEAYYEKFDYYGIDHFSQAEYVYEIGGNFLYLRQADSAIYYLNKAMNLYDSTEVNNIVVAIKNDLGLALGMQKKYREQEQVLLDVLELKQKIYGPDNLYNAPSLLGLGHAYMYQDKLDEAEKAYLKALHINEAKLSIGHQNIAACRLALARIYLRQQKYNKSLSYIEPTLEEIKDKLPPEHQLFGFGYLFQGQCLKALQKPDEARTILEKSLSIFKHLNIKDYIVKVQSELEALSSVQ